VFFHLLCIQHAKKKILNHYTTKKGRKHKKLGIGSNEHSEKGSVTQKKLKLFYCEKSENKIKAEHQKNLSFCVFQPVVMEFLR